VSATAAAVGTAAARGWDPGLAWALPANDDKNSAAAPTAATRDTSVLLDIGVSPCLGPGDRAGHRK